MKADANIAVILCTALQSNLHLQDSQSALHWNKHVYKYQVIPNNKRNIHNNLPKLYKLNVGLITETICCFPPQQHSAVLRHLLFVLSII